MTVQKNKNIIVSTPSALDLFLMQNIFYFLNLSKYLLIPSIISIIFFVYFKQNIFVALLFFVFFFFLEQILLLIKILISIKNFGTFQTKHIFFEKRFQIVSPYFKLSIPYSNIKVVKKYGKYLLFIFKYQIRPNMICLKTKKFNLPTITQKSFYQLKW